MSKDNDYRFTVAFRFVDLGPARSDTASLPPVSPEIRQNSFGNPPPSAGEFSTSSSSHLNLFRGGAASSVVSNLSQSGTAITAKMGE